MQFKSAGLMHAIPRSQKKWCVPWSAARVRLPILCALLTCCQQVRFVCLAQYITLAKSLHADKHISPAMSALFPYVLLSSQKAQQESHKNTPGTSLSQPCARGLVPAPPPALPAAPCGHPGLLHGPPAHPDGSPDPRPHPCHPGFCHGHPGPPEKLPAHHPEPCWKCATTAEQAPGARQALGGPRERPQLGQQARMGPRTPVSGRAAPAHAGAAAARHKRCWPR